MKHKYLIITLISILSVVVVDYFVGTSEPLVISNQNQPEQTEKSVIMEYGIPVDSFYTEEGSIKFGQTIGNILLSNNVSAQLVSELTNGKNCFDPRKFKAGHNYKLFRTKDSSQTLRYLVYIENPVESIVFSIGDSLSISPFQKNIKAIRKIKRATISSSLWETMKNENINPLLALDLSEIFAWTIDFFALYPGDSFEVIYDELYIDSTSVGLGTIYAAWFEHQSERFYAFRFEQDSVAGYWDENGNSLRKSFLKAPLRFSRISSRFSRHRLHPVLRIYRPHTGVDYVAPAGTPVMAIGDGIVIAKGFNYAAGNYVKIKHNSVYTTGYNHFSRFAKSLQVGARVKQGDVIGYVGKTGYATGPHLDFRFWKNGKPVDPLKVQAPPVEPIHPENLAAFLIVKESLISQLGMGESQENRHVIAVNGQKLSVCQ
ncbi:MAG TPA: peptidoglycan DD-metalloendopeptidase family protein [Tenuifilaceae bacterium]|nr:peptidoglycan DD-metalloendopeptidase family protein [Tenuifilaceae bacterium]